MVSSACAQEGAIPFLSIESSKSEDWATSHRRSYRAKQLVLSLSSTHALSSHFYHTLPRRALHVN